MDLLTIEHADGRQYAVSPAVFKKRYEPEGFKATGYESGKEYTPPQPKADKPKAEESKP